MDISVYINVGGYFTTMRTDILQFYLKSGCLGKWFFLSTDKSNKWILLVCTGLLKILNYYRSCLPQDLCKGWFWNPAMAIRRENSPSTWNKKVKDRSQERSASLTCSFLFLAAAWMCSKMTKSSSLHLINSLGGKTFCTNTARVRLLLKKKRILK